MRSTARNTDIKIDSTQSQLQLDSLKAEASAVGLEINIKETKQLCLNQPTTVAQDP